MTAGTNILVGPEDDPDPEWSCIPGVVRPGAVALERLPLLAREASVLVVPYADPSVNWAMQPPELEEYLAIEKPVVVRDLPANRQWADAPDLAVKAEEFARLVPRRLRQAPPHPPLAVKAEEFARLVLLRMVEGIWTAKVAARRRLPKAACADEVRLFAGWLEWPNPSPAPPTQGTDLRSSGPGPKDEFWRRALIPTVILDVRVIVGAS